MRGGTREGERMDGGVYAEGGRRGRRVFRFGVELVEAEEARLRAEGEEWTLWEVKERGEVERMD